MKNKIRPIYSELQGCLSRAPSPERNTIMDQPEFWNHHNSIIDELNQVTGENYDKYKIQVENINWNGSYRQKIDIQTYRTKLAGLISRLHGAYFSDEQPPFSEMPNTVINQTQNQSQSQSVSVLLEIQEKIISEIGNHSEGSKERNFLQKIKDLLPSIKTTTEIFSTILKIGADFGLSSEEIHKLLRF